MQVPKAVREISRDGTGDGTLTSCTGSSFILQWHHQFNLVQAGGKGWAPGEHVFSSQSFLCFFCFLFLFYFCADAVYQCIHRHITFNQLPSAWESLGTPVNARLSVLLLDPFHHGEWSRWHRHLQSGRENP